MEGLDLAIIGLSFLGYAVSAFAIASIISSSISLYHSLKEEERRTEFIVFSSLGLGLSVLGLFFGLIFVIAGIVFTIISMGTDEKVRKLALYIILPLVIAAALAGGSYYLIDRAVDSMNIEPIGMDTIKGLGG